jgi:hypothetical protein
MITDNHLILCLSFLNTADAEAVKALCFMPMDQHEIGLNGKSLSIV